MRATDASQGHLDPALAEVLASGGTVVTANRHLARWLSREFGEFQRDRGELVWESPDVLPWKLWLRRVWSEALWDRDSRAWAVPLRAAQEQALWESVLAQSLDAEALLQLSAAAREARQAWEILCGWSLSLDELGPDVSRESRAFAGWALQVWRECRRRGWIDSASLPAAVCEGLTSGRICTPAVLVLAGFCELTPAQRGLVAALQGAGTDIRIHEPRVCEGTPIRVGLADSHAELRCAAQWARDHVAARPGARIAVIVPDLAELRQGVERVFGEVMAPGSMREAGDTDSAFHVSLGRPLAGVAMIHAALLALELAAGPMSCEHTGQLLRSPYIGEFGSEASRRALLDARMRAAGLLAITPAAIQFHARGGSEATAPHACPALARRLGLYRAAIAQAPAAGLPSSWTQVFVSLLTSLGWAADRGLSSAEYQARQQWHEVLGEFGALDVLTGRIGFAGALSRLRKLASDTVFQPGSADSPIEVMGTLEAAGRSFDAAWVTGLRDDRWPAAPRPNPFLPIALQRQHGLPHASAERELEYARRVTQRLLSCAPEVIVSWPRQQDDEMLRPSPLIADLPEKPHLRLRTDPPEEYRAAIFASRDLETLAPDPAPAVDPSAALRGGTAILKYQALCPFRAFAELRLHARPLEAPANGVDSLTRGNLVHAVLEVLWRGLGDQSALLRLPAAELHSRIRSAARSAVRHWLPATDRRTRRIARLERARVEQLISQFMEQEKRRPAFSVEACEEQQEIRLAGLAVRARADRVDRLASGGRIVIDYKTGVAVPAKWFGTRPEEPQLPVYATANAHDLVGILFGTLRAGEVGYRGATRDRDLIPAVPAFGEWPRSPADSASWSEQLKIWKATLARLAGAFAAGDARVDPKPSGACSYCHLAVLCRIDEVAHRAEQHSGGQS